MIFKLIISVLAFCSIGCTVFTVTPSDRTINAQTSYTWIITFSPISNRTAITFSFPSTVTVTNNSSVIYNSGLLAISSFTSNTISFSASGIGAVNNATITVTNVVNPPSAIPSTTDFTITSDFQTNLPLELFNSVSYTNALLSTCNWVFSLCTEQPNSILTISVTTSNAIYSGSNQILIGYEAVWANHNSKGLMFQVITFACSISFDNGTTFQTVVCTNSAPSNMITLTFTTTSNILASSSIIIKIQGVESPPTQTTPISTNYYVSTSDSNGYLIDSYSGCAIEPVCITNVTDGVFTTSTLVVNQVLTDQQINFISYPIITVLPSDIVEISFDPISNLNNCGSLKFWRNILNLKNLSPHPSTNLSFIFPSDNFQIIDSAYPIYLYIACTSITIPSSTASVPMTFFFKRSNSYYLILTAIINPQPAGLDLTSTSLVLSSTQMINANTIYTFSFNNGQPLGDNCAIKIGFSADIVFSNATSCTVRINAVTVVSACSVDTINSLVVNVTAGSIVSSSSTFQISVGGITNPSLPQMYNFTLTTYYNSSDLLSQVQFASPAFNTTFTAITTIFPTTSPTTHTVYTATTVNISFVTTIPIPVNSIFYATFPTEVTSLAVSSQPLFVDGNIHPVTNFSSNVSNNSLSFQILQAINANSTIVISSSLRTPSTLGTYTYISFTISKGNNYIESFNYLSLSVSVPSTMPVTITSDNPTTSATTSYSLAISFTIPHPNNFDIQIDLPADTIFIIPSSSCSPNCAISSTTPNGSQVILTVTNSNPNSTSLFTETYTINSFKNRRFVGIGAVANVTTYQTSSSNVITVSSTTIDISVPNILVGQLDPNVQYFRNNSAIVDLYINISATTLIVGDYLLIDMDRTTYTGTSLTCISLLSSCIIDSSSTTNVLVINIAPNLTTFVSNPLHIKIEGLTSGFDTTYFQTDYFTVSLLSPEGLMETGRIPYQIDCGFASANQCKTCLSNGNCITCYSQSGYYLNVDICVTHCGNSSQYLRFADNTTNICQSCSGTCLTCINSTACLTCLNSSYYLYTDTLVCDLTCPTSSGYINSVIGSQVTCTPCADPFCLQCNTTDYATCTLCNNISALVNGICSSVCPNVSHYIFNSLCHSCDASCYTCYGPSNLACIRCSSGYVNFSNTCVSTCPNGTALIINLGICGCDSSCLTCDSANSVNCTTCANTSHFVYFGQCIGVCPNGSYQLGLECFQCPSGCDTCDSLNCLSCLTGWYFFGGVCYSDCNLISRQYDASGSLCVLCPNNCDTCSGTLCTSCLSNFALQGNSCVDECQATNSCAVDTSKVIPLPGLIGVVLWGIAMIVIHVIWSASYLPYAILFLSSVFQFGLLFALVIVTGNSQARLLLVTSSNYKEVMVGLLASCLALNYILNIIYVIVFIRYMRHLIHRPKQTDYIAHTVVLVVACLTNYRFGLLVFAKLCEKPRVQIDNSSRMTPIHYLCICTTFFDILVFVACGIGIYQAQALSTIFMLSLDLLILVILNILITVWFVVSSKPDSYYKSETKYEVNGETIITKQEMTAEKENSKDASKINILIDESSEKNQIQNIDLGARHKSTRAVKIKAKGQSELMKSQTEEMRNKGDKSSVDPAVGNFYISEVEQLQQTDIHFNDKQLFADDNFEHPIPLKKTMLDLGNSKITEIPMRSKSRYVDSRQTVADQYNLDKEVFDKEYKPDDNIFQASFEDEEYQMPNLQQKSNYEQKGEKVHHSQLVKLEKIEQQRMARNNPARSSLPTGISSLSKKDPKQIPILELEQEDFRTTVLRKVEKSSIHKKEKINIENSSDISEDISPTKYNEQNLRFESL